MDDVLGAHGFVVFWPSGSKIKATFGEGALCIIHHAKGSLSAEIPYSCQTLHQHAGHVGQTTQVFRDPSIFMGAWQAGILDVLSGSLLSMEEILNKWDV